MTLYRIRNHNPYPVLHYQPQRKGQTMKLYAYMTADVVTPDGSDTDVYGDGTLEGHGAEHTSGWVDPDWSRTTVYDTVTDAFAVYDPADDDRTPEQWTADLLNEYIGAYEDNGDGTYYASDSEPDYATGADYSYAVHIRTTPLGK